MESNSYIELFNNDFLTIPESEELLKLSANGDLDARWKLVISQAKLVKHVILKFFPNNFNNNSISDGFMSLYNSASYKGNKNVHFMQFRRIAMLNMYSYVSKRIKERSRISRLNYYGFGGHQEFKEIRIDSFSDNEYMQIVDEDDPVILKVINNDAKEFCINKIKNIKNRKTKERINKLLKAISNEKNEFDPLKIETTRQNLFNIKQRVKKDILKECPEILEAL